MKSSNIESAKNTEMNLANEPENARDEINMSELKRSSSLKNTVVDNDKHENEVDSHGNEVGGEQKRKSS